MSICLIIFAFVEKKTSKLGIKSNKTHNTKKWKIVLVYVNQVK